MPTTQPRVAAAMIQPYSFEIIGLFYWFVLKISSKQKMKTLLKAPIYQSKTLPTSDF
jgi:hypothetical protein